MVFSYDFLYLCGIFCCFSSFISYFVYLGSLSVCLFIIADLQGPWGRRGLCVHMGGTGNLFLSLISGPCLCSSTTCWARFVSLAWCWHSSLLPVDKCCLGQTGMWGWRRDRDWLDILGHLPPNFHHAQTSSFLQFLSSHQSGPVSVSIWCFLYVHPSAQNFRLHDSTLLGQIYSVFVSFYFFHYFI